MVYEAATSLSWQPCIGPLLASSKANTLFSPFQVEYVITYTSAGEITAAAVNFSATDASFGTQILQRHAVQFQVRMLLLLVFILCIVTFSIASV